MGGSIAPIIPSEIHLYEDPSSRSLRLREIASYLRERLGELRVDIRGPLLSAGSPELEEALARKLAGARVRDLTNPEAQLEPLPLEIEFEKKLLRNPDLRMVGVLYDGFKLQALLWELLPAEERSLEYVHIAFTGRLFGTFDESDRRYHARVSIYGFPSLISTTGIVEAPAKPKEFYLLRRQYAALKLEVPVEVLEEKFKGKFIGYDDERLTEVMKGYTMQAIFYHVFGEPFCKEVNCRLFNSHWQEEVIKSQLEPREKEFCERHEEMLSQLRQALECSASNQRS
ncbi:MAG: hypothetical protein NZ934_00485 [Hadesarchaea archaeon]|nr:hypothetical protein [Hadesarchaea archaeon]